MLRAAQIDAFVAQLVDWGRRGDVSYMPKMRTQLVADEAGGVPPGPTATLAGATFEERLRATG